MGSRGWGLRLARWWLVLLGGTLLGGGLVLHAQVALARHAREEVQRTFFLWRGIGQLTFIFQDDRTKLALWMNEVPPNVLRESDRGAWTLIVLGGVLALAAPMCTRGRTRRRAGK